NENLDREIGIDVVLTHECDHLAIDFPFHDSYEVVPHRGLVVVAELQDPVRAAVRDERALARRERVREQDRDYVVADCGLRLRRSSTGGLVQYLNRGGGDLRRAALALPLHGDTFQAQPGW